MQFRRLRLTGFKSFVEPTELRIEPGLTGVVGPNGCGKSNLLEAIRWVMGEGSPKSLRSAGMDDVIFAGTAARPSRQFADVTLTLDNSDRLAPVGFNDSDDIEVVRRIERGLGSAYRLNGRDVRLRDVQLLFADGATGAHSPALVSQGRIGAIIAARPEERRLLLEEAAGISGLHVRRNEAEIRLRAADANLARLDDVNKGSEAQAAALRRQARAAERYTALSDRIRAAEAALLFARWRAAATAADEARAAAAAADALVGETTREAARLSTLQADATAALPGLREAEAVAAAALQHLVQRRAALTAELTRVEARQRELDAARAAGERDRVREAALAGDAAAALARIEAELCGLAGQVEAGREGLPALVIAVDLAEQSVSSGEADLSVAIEAQARAMAQARAADAAIQAAEARLGRTRAEVARQVAARVALSSGPDETAKRDAAQAALDRATAEIAAASEALAKADVDRKATDAAREAARRDAAEVRGQLAALTAERDAVARVLATRADAAATALDRIDVKPGFEAALVAALGDDLSAGIGEGSRRWAGTVPGDNDPTLPDGVQPLAEVVTAPAELARRIGQVGIVDGDAGDAMSASLQPGQRLVSRDGRMWRWDGFRSAGGEGRAAAERLVQRARLVEIERDLPNLRAAGEAAAVTVSGADRAVADVIRAETEARASRAAGERALATARTELARAATEIDRHAARLEAVDAALARLAAEVEALGGEVQAAREAAAEVTGLPAPAATVSKLRGEVETARTALAKARATHDAQARGIAAGVARSRELTAEAGRWAERRDAGVRQGLELAERAAAVVSEIEALATRPAEIIAAVAALASETADAEALRRAAADRLTVTENDLRTVDAGVRAAAAKLADVREVRARAAANAEHQDARRIEYATLCGERFQTAPVRLPELFGFTPGGDVAALDASFTALTAERERLGPVNLRAATELAEIETALASSAAERAELETAIARLRGSIGALNREGRVRLLEAFKIVDGHFRELFGILFEGGAAHLALTDADDPLAAGLEIMAQPPGKKLQSLTLLSGGEQALTAIALIFALFLTTPAPLCVLDEVDAPLDDANVERFCDLLDRMAAMTATRFLIVTHNAVTMSRMHRLYGVTMGEPGVSQLVSVDLARAESLLAA